MTDTTITLARSRMAATLPASPGPILSRMP